MAKSEASLVQDTSREHEVETARNLPDAANADQSIQGYASINGLDEETEIARVAYELFQKRGEENGDADGDWFRAQQEVRRRRSL
ncbi:MAG TPA: DUF2934 domain-containing protein [Bryobacteraceae bacterium]|nr:DUF2934 domain-containing protein [Bryobacteraceae bacterium]